MQVHGLRHDELVRTIRNLGRPLTCQFHTELRGVGANLVRQSSERVVDAEQVWLCEDVDRDVANTLNRQFSAVSDISVETLSPEAHDQFEDALDVLDVPALADAAAAPAGSGATYSAAGDGQQKSRMRGLGLAGVGWKRRLLLLATAAVVTAA